MKKFAIIAAALLMGVASYAQSAKSIYNKYSEEPKVSAVYISPAMFRLMGSLPEISMPDGDINLGPIIKDMQGMYLIDSENLDINRSIREDAEKLVKSGKYELMLEAKDDGEVVRIYTENKGEDIITSFVMIASEQDECVFISINGTIPRAELEKLIASSME